MGRTPSLLTSFQYVPFQDAFLLYLLPKSILTRTVKRQGKRGQENGGEEESSKIYMLLPSSMPKNHKYATHTNEILILHKPAQNTWSSTVSSTSFVSFVFVPQFSSSLCYIRCSSSVICIIAMTLQSTPFSTILLISIFSCTLCFQLVIVSYMCQLIRLGYTVI